MQKRKSGNLILYAAVILIILFAIAAIVMIFFTRENEDAVSELYNDNMGLTVELYAERANNIFDRVGVSADTAASLLEIYVVGENSWTKEALDSIVNSSAAYGVVYYKNEASMVTSTGLDTPDVSGYKSSFQGDKHFFHIDDDGISGQSAFVYSIPMKKDANYRGYLLTYISDEDIEEVFSEFPYELDAFYAIVDEGSNVQSMIDGTESTGYFEGSFWDNVRTYAENSSQLEVFNDGIMDNKYSSVNVNMNGERRIIYTSPIASKTWLLVMGIKAESIENKGSVLRRENDRYQVIMLVILAGMLGTIAVAAVLVGLRERKNKKELENKADTDLLTGISNKIATERQIREYIAANPGSQAVMIVMDIDNFKKINDTMGHAFGDEVIKSVGHQLKSMFRITDVVGRLGGDEFIVLLKNIRDSKVIDKECRLLEECFHNFEVGEYVKYSVTASIGVAIFPRDADSFEKLYKAADSALYSAKRKGKNQLAFYNESKS